MPNRTIIIFGLFLIVAIIGSVFIYFYQDYAENLVGRYISKITICENITNEEVCFDKSFCEGIYGPTCPSCNDNVFRRCQRIPLGVIAQIQREMALCTQTGGEWFSGKLGEFCVCQEVGTNKIFDSIKGCIKLND